MVVKPTTSDMKEAAREVAKREVAKELLEESLLSAKEVADILGLSALTVRRWAKKGRLEAIRMSRKCLRFRRSDVKAFIEALKKHTEAQTPKKKGRRKASEENGD